MSARDLRRSPLACALVGAALLLGVAGWASGPGKPGSGNPFAQELAERNQIRIRVVNMNFNDATVWALVRERGIDECALPPFTPV